VKRRRRETGSVFYSASDRAWIARVSLGVVNGKRIGRKVRAATEDEALDQLERLRRAYGIGSVPADQTLDEYLQGWLDANRKVRASTLRSYREHVDRHISALLGGIEVVRLRPADVERLVADRLKATSQRGRPLSPATVGHIVQTLRIALNHGVRRGELQRNVAAMVDLPRVDHAPVVPMTDAEAQRLVDAFSGHWLGPLVRLLSGSALRLGEALSLNQSDIGEGFVRIRRSKTTLRAVPITEDAEDAAREARMAAPRNGPNEPLFFGPRPNRQGHRDRLSGSTVSHAVPRVIEAGGLARLTPHGFRHGAATIMVAKGAHIRVVAEQLGHKNPSLTLRTYAHVSPDSQRDAVRLLEREKRPATPRIP
jgi:integrase